MDISAPLNELLKERGSPPVGSPPKLDHLEGFLKEAYRINSLIHNLHSELCDIRQAYLSTAQPRKGHHPRTGTAAPQRLSDRERELIDATAKKSIRGLDASIRELSDAEQLRRDTETALMQKKYGRGLGALGSWAGGGLGLGKSAEQSAAEGRALDVAKHRDEVILFLRQHLEVCCGTQQVMMEKRLTREMEKNRSVLSRMGTGGVMPFQDASSFRPQDPAAARPKPASQHGPSAAAAAAAAETSVYAEAQGLTEEQVQMFEKGNQDMMQHIEGEVDKIRMAQKSLLEIAELQNTLMSNLSVQKEQIDLLAADEHATEGNIRGGNKELAKAAKRPSTAKYTFFAASGLCAFLIIWDLVV